MHSDRMSLPEFYLVTPEPMSGGAEDRAAFLVQLAATLATGPFLVQLRTKTLSTDDFAVLAAEAIACCHARGMRVVLNGPLVPEDALALGADGVHLGGPALHAASARPLARDALLSAACHTFDDLHAAAKLGVDCALLSPVLPTLSHPGAAVLGWQRFATWASRTDLPVYALGGMTRAHLAIAHKHGAHGIAGIRGFWRGPALQPSSPAATLIDRPSTARLK